MKRLLPLDGLRGFIMIVMALDHANLFIAHGHPPPEIWVGPFPVYSNAVPFLTRVVTHLAAPGFFFLMGASMMLFAGSREQLGWTHGRVVRTLALRGALLMVLQVLVEDLAWLWGSNGALASNGLQIYLGVLYGLGGAMILGAFLLRLKTPALLALSAGILIGTELVIRSFPPQALQNPLIHLFLLASATPAYEVLYPILPWLGVTCFGMVFGRWCAENAETAYRRALLLGTSFLVIYFPLRALNGFGNIRAQVGTGWIAFFNNVKYPPSITFLLLALGVDLTALFALSRRALALLLRPLSPLIVFGSTPLFFYLVHLYLYGTIGRFIFPEGISIPAMYPWWLAGLVVLYPLCLLYGRFKQGQPADSVWRFF